MIGSLKKLLVLICIPLLLLACTAQASPSASTGTAFNALVVEQTETSVLIATEDNIGQGGGPALLSIQSSLDLLPGNLLHITCEGVFQETYPLGIAGDYTIELISSEQTDVSKYAELIQNLTSP